MKMSSRLLFVGAIVFAIGALLYYRGLTTSVGAVSGEDLPESGSGVAVRAGLAWLILAGTGFVMFVAGVVQSLRGR